MNLNVPKTSAKIKTNTMLTNILPCILTARMPASPTIPIANPAARLHNPTASPLPKFTNAV